MYNSMIRYLRTVYIFSSLVRRRITRHLTRLQAMYNVLKYRTTWWKNEKISFIGTGAEPKNNRILQQLNNVQWSIAHYLIAVLSGYYCNNFLFQIMSLLRIAGTSLIFISLVWATFATAVNYWYYLHVINKSGESIGYVHIGLWKKCVQVLDGGTKCWTWDYIKKKADDRLGERLSFCLSVLYAY